MRKFLVVFTLCSFSFFVSNAQTYNESEPNDSFEQANLVTAPVTIIATSGSDDDLDFFKVDLASATVITITLTEIQPNQFFRLHAYNSSENQIGFVQSPEDGAGYTYHFLLPAGISYFKVYDYGDNPSSIAYNLELEVDTSDGCEDNNSFETACLISPDVTLHPQLFGMNSDLGGDDTDYYKFDLPESGVVTFNLSNLGAGQFIRFNAYNSEHSQIAFTQSPEDGVGFSFDVLFPTGVSYFHIYDYQSSSDSVHLNLELLFDNSDGCEDNNSFETACLVSPDATLHPQLFGTNSDLGGDDIDYYMLDLPVSGVVTFNLSNLGAGQFVRMNAYNSEKGQIAYVQSSENGEGFNYDILFPSGVSYFRLLDYRSSSDSIHLDLNLSFDDTDGCEDNNSFETACQVSPDAILYPQLFGTNSDLGGDDVDFYTFQVGNCLSQCFTVSNVQESQFIRMNIYDADHSQVGYAQSTDNGEGFFYCLELEQGEYFIRILDYNSSSNSEAITLELNCVSLGIDDTTLDKSVSVFPNPTSGSFNVIFPDGSTKVQIINSLGQTVRTEWVDNQQKLEFTIKKQGIYFIRIKTDEGVIIRKLIITN